MWTNEYGQPLGDWTDAIMEVGGDLLDNVGDIASAAASAAPAIITAINSGKKPSTPTYPYGAVPGYPYGTPAAYPGGYLPTGIPPTGLPTYRPPTPYPTGYPTTSGLPSSLSSMMPLLLLAGGGLALFFLMRKK